MLQKNQSEKEISEIENDLKDLYISKNKLEKLEKNVEEILKKGQKNHDKNERNVHENLME